MSGMEDKSIGNNEAELCQFDEPLFDYEPTESDEEAFNEWNHHSEVEDPDSEDESYKEHCKKMEAMEAVDIEISQMYRDAYEEKGFEGYYFVTASPFNDKYADDEAWYKGKLCFNAVKRQLKSPHPCVMVREYDAAKVHIHAVCKSDRDLAKMYARDKDGKPYRGYKYTYDVRRVKSVDDLKRILKYMQKENIGEWQKGVHYQISPKRTLKSENKRASRVARPEGQKSKVQRKKGT